MENNVNSTSSGHTREELPHPEQSRLRDARRVDGVAGGVRFDGLHESLGSVDPVRDLAEEERQKRAEEQAFLDKSRVLMGRSARTIESARAAAGFDPRNRGIQSAEFYRISDPEIRRFGYF